LNRFLPDSLPPEHPAVDVMILAAVALALVAWLAVALVRGGMVGTALLVLLTGACFGHSFFHVAAGGPMPITADRILLAVLVGQYVFYRKFGGADPKPLAKIDVLLAVFLLVILASTLTHDFRIERWRPLAFFVFFYAMPAVMYWIARQTQWTERAAWCLFAALGVFSLYLCLTAVAETHGWWFAVYPRYIGSPKVWEFLGRGRGPFLNPIANGIVQSVGLCAALLWWPRLSRRGQLVLLGLMPFYAWGIYSTLTRSVWMGAAAGVFVILLLTLPRMWRTAMVVTAVVGSLLFVVVSWESLMTFKRDKELDAELTAESAKLRPILATVAWHMFLDRPLLGCGFGQYAEVMPDYLADRSTELPLKKARPFVQHNAFLALLTETGLVGVSLFVAVLAWWTLDAWLLWRSVELASWTRQFGLLWLATMGIYLPNAMFHDVSIIAMVHMLMFYLAGAVVGLKLKAGVVGGWWLVVGEKRHLLAQWLPAPRHPQPIASSSPITNH